MRPRDLSHRSREIEWLDGAGAGATELEFFLRDLARLNSVMFGHRAVIAWLHRATKDALSERPLTILDAGCGYGDLLRAIRRWARKRGLAARLIGLDRSRETISIAQAAGAETDDIEYQVGDIFEFRPLERIDLVVSSLLAHHLSDELIVRFLRWMEVTAHRGWLIYDLPASPGAALFYCADRQADPPQPAYDPGRPDFGRTLANGGGMARTAGRGGHRLRIGTAALVSFPLRHWPVEVIAGAVSPEQPLPIEC